MLCASVVFPLFDIIMSVYGSANLELLAQGLAVDTLFQDTHTALVMSKHRSYVISTKPLCLMC